MFSSEWVTASRLITTIGRPVALLTGVGHCRMVAVFGNPRFQILGFGKLTPPVVDALTGGELEYRLAAELRRELQDGARESDPVVDEVEPCSYQEEGTNPVHEW